MLLVTDEEPKLKHYEQLLLDLMIPDKSVYKRLVLGFGFNDLNHLDTHVIEYDAEYNKLFRLYTYVVNDPNSLYPKYKVPYGYIENPHDVTDIRMSLQISYLTEKMKQLKVYQQQKHATMNVEWRLIIGGRVCR